MQPESALAPRMRDLLVRSGRYEVSRLDDHQVRAASRSLLHSAATLRNLGDIETVLAFFSHSVAGDRIGLRQLLGRAVEMLDFRVDPDRGLLYAGQYATAADPWKAPDNRLTPQIREKAAPPGKTAIGQTVGGRWLMRWNLRYMVGGDGEDAVWARATGRFTESFSGEVEVLLAYADFDHVFRALPSHPIFKIQRIAKVVYFLDDSARRMLNPPPELFTTGVVKKAFGLDLVFRAAR
jgi:hypothetical protein